MINSSIGLMGSVGHNGRNDTLDVTNVQDRLNELMGDSRKPLVVDGQSGSKTRGMIADFQISVVGFQRPDSRVDPIGKTIIALNDPNSASIWQRMSIPPAIIPAVAPSKPSGPSKPAHRVGTKPRALSAAEILGTEPGGFIRWVDSGSPKGVAMAKAGEIWEGPEGKRRIIHAREWEISVGGSLKPDGVVTYQQLTSDDATAKPGVIYRQNREGFVTDMLYAGFAIAGKNLEATKVLIEAEMNFILAVASANPVVFAADIGLNVVEWTAKNKDNFPKWIAAISILFSVRATLKKYTPTLWDKIVDAALLAAWKGSKAAIAMFGADVAGNIPDAMVSDPKKIAKLAGSLLGKIGAAGFKGRMGALKAVWAILSTVATKAALAIPSAVKITALEKKKTAEELIAALRKAGVALAEGDAETIAEEVANNAGKVKDALKKLKGGFDALK